MGPTSHKSNQLERYQKSILTKRTIIAVKPQTIFFKKICEVVCDIFENLAINRVNNHLKVDKKEFIGILKNHQQLIFKICHSYCPNAEDRNDLQQEIAIQVWKSLQKFDNGVKLSTWIYRVALNTAISFNRKNAKNEKHQYFEESLLIVDDHEHQQVMDENIAELYRFINTLGDLEKALMLLFLDEKPQKEISEILGITTSNVSTKISRIKTQLKTHFKNIQ